MTTVSSLIMLIGALVGLLAAVGLTRFQTPYARFHAAGKASPIAFLICAVGAGLELGPVSAGPLAVAALAMTLTLPVGVHLLFKAVHGQAADNDHLRVDELADDLATQSADSPRG